MYCLEAFHRPEISSISALSSGSTDQVPSHVIGAENCLKLYTTINSLALSLCLASVQQLLALWSRAPDDPSLVIGGTNHVRKEAALQPTMT